MAAGVNCGPGLRINHYPLLIHSIEGRSCELIRLYFMIGLNDLDKGRQDFQCSLVAAS